VAVCDNTCPYWGYQCNINEMQKDCHKPIKLDTANNNPYDLGKKKRE